MAGQLRIVYLDGPGDAIASYRHWRGGRDNPDITHVPFTSQFYDLCEALNARALVLSENPQLACIEDGNFRIEHRGNASIGKRGMAFHHAELQHARKVLWEIAKFKPHIAIVPARPYPFLLWALRLMGIRVVMMLHCVLWHKYRPPRGVNRLLRILDKPFYRWGPDAVLCVSEEIKRQVRQLSGCDTVPFVDFLPLYRETTFADIRPADVDARPFRVMFAGRVERYKGVFDLLAIAQRLVQRGRDDIVFELCGSGADLQQLQEQTQYMDLQHVFQLRGWCNHGQMRESFSRSHVVIAPTTTDFIEGFNAVVVEAVLANRPVISSPVCPALEYLRGAVVTVPPNDVQAYEDAIVELVDNRETYQQLQRASEQVRSMFLDETCSFHAALNHAVRAILARRPVQPREITPEIAATAGHGAGEGAGAEAATGQDSPGSRTPAARGAV